jgi:lipoprotein-anchoring transpeptidase ErfK/SrfK
LLVARGAKKNARTRRHGTDALWLAGYAGKVDVTQYLLGVQPGSDADRTSVEVDLSAQTATILRDGTSVKTAPISSGKKNFRTPTGEYVVTNKHRHWKSTLYGASMPFYLRLSCRDFGLHAGHLPGYPASHGCIRLPGHMAEKFYHAVNLGTPVRIVP